MLTHHNYPILIFYTLVVLHSIGLSKFICIHHYNIIQNIFSDLKVLCAVMIYASSPTLKLCNHWFHYCLHSFDLSRVSFHEIIYCSVLWDFFLKWWRFSRSVMSHSCSFMDCSPPGSSVHGISQARILEWVAISFSRGSSQSRDWTRVSCIAGRFEAVCVANFRIKTWERTWKRLLRDRDLCFEVWEAQFRIVSYNIGEGFCNHSSCPLCKYVKQTQDWSVEALLYFPRLIQLSLYRQKDRINSVFTFPLLESLSCYHSNSVCRYDDN